jgi:hypothetical protein
MIIRSPMSDFVVPLKPSPPISTIAPAADSAMPPTFAAVGLSRARAIAAASAKMGIVVMRIAAACAVVSARPARKSVWLITTPRMEKPKSRRPSPGSSGAAFRSRSTVLRMIAAASTRKYANVSGLNTCIPIFEMM